MEGFIKSIRILIILININIDKSYVLSFKMLLRTLYIMKFIYYLFCFEQRIIFLKKKILFKKLLLWKLISLNISIFTITLL